MYLNVRSVMEAYIEFVFCIVTCESENSFLFLDQKWELNKHALEFEKIFQKSCFSVVSIFYKGFCPGLCVCILMCYALNYSLNMNVGR